jgi:hypothetical protein
MPAASRSTLAAATTRLDVMDLRCPVCVPSHRMDENDPIHYGGIEYWICAASGTARWFRLSDEGKLVEVPAPEM